MQINQIYLCTPYKTVLLRLHFMKFPYSEEILLSLLGCWKKILNDISLHIFFYKLP